MRPGETISLFDGSGSEWPAAITAIERDIVRVLPGAPHTPPTEPKLQVTVCPALIPADRMEFVLQKCTELGAARFRPLLTERVQAKDAQVSANRLERWQKIVIEAAEQSGRAVVPPILPAQRLAHTVVQLAAEGPVVLLWEEEAAKNLRIAVRESLAKGPRHITILIGPVGGLSQAEVAIAHSADAITAGLGRRILRAETAPVTALSALMYEAGELG
jgi:16S rRNA (uracil1498-N3)-methyltransferase